MKSAITLNAIAALLLIGCSENGTQQIEIHGSAACAIHDPTAMIIQDQYVLQFTIRNISNAELTFDRMEETWSFAGRGAGLTQTVLPQAGFWRLAQGQERTFVSNTDGYTLQLHDAANGKPITLSVTLFQGPSALLGPYTATLPRLEDLPRTDYSLVVLRSSEPSPEIDLSKLPIPKLVPVTFRAR